MCRNRSLGYTVSIYDTGRDDECFLADFAFHEKWLELKPGHCFLRQLSSTGKYALKN